MRKSIFLTVFVMLFAGIANIYAQGCTGTGNTPALGVDYIYEVSVGNGQPDYDGDGSYIWYVTQETNLLGGGELELTNDYFLVKDAETGGFSSYNKTTNTSQKLKLNWKEAALGSDKPFYLVVNYSEENFTGCAPNNIKVIKIQPLNTFELAITPVKDEAGAEFDGGTAKVCAADVAGATIEGDNVKYLYGVQTLYYKVTAKGFKGQWKPQIRIPALGDAGRKYTSVQWKQAGGSFTDFKETIEDDGTQQDLTAKDNDFATIQDADNGTPIIVKVVIDNGTFEGLEDKNIELAVDGTIKDTTKSDINGGTESDACNEADEFGKKGTSTIKARPKIEATSGTFVVKI